MPIEFKCAQCQKEFSVADSSAGKQGRCSDCGHLNTIPDPGGATSSPSQSAAQAIAATFEVSSSVNGAVFGPADKQTLNQWVEEGRITPDCQIKQVGSENWRPAKEVFSKFGAQNGASGTPDPFSKFKAEPMAGAAAAGAASTSANPYAASSAVKKQGDAYGEIVPTSGDIGFILRHAYETFKNNTGLMVGAFLIYMILAMINGQIPTIFGAALDIPGAVIGFLINLVIGTFIWAGMMNLSFKAARGEQAQLGDLFGSGDRILPLIGFTIVTYGAMLIPLFIVGLLAGLAGAAGGENFAPVGVGVGIAIMLLFFMVLGLLFWSSFFLIADRKAKVFQAFPMGLAIGKKNVLQIIAVSIISGLVGFAGILLLFIGVIFTGPLAFLIISTAYLVMSGQVRE